MPPESAGTARRQPKGKISMKRSMWFLVGFGAVCACCLAALLAAPVVARAATLSSTPDPHLWVTDGNVYAIAAAPNGTTYIGGAFDYVGPLTGGGATGRRRAALSRAGWARGRAASRWRFPTAPAATTSAATS